MSAEKTARPTAAPGEALSDFNILRLVAKYWGCDALFSEWSSPEAAFQILKRLSAGRPCDISGIEDYAHLEREGGIQWPWPGSPPTADRENGATELKTENSERKTPSERRLFEDGRFFTADQRALFLFDPPRAPAEALTAEFPMVLLTGRGTSAQWHTNTRTGKSAVLRTLHPENAYVELHPEDARDLRIQPNATVRVVSPRGAVECVAFVTSSVQRGQVFMPMHYEVTNELTAPEVDPHSRQPSYKYAAVRVEALNEI